MFWNNMLGNRKGNLRALLISKKIRNFFCKKIIWQLEKYNKINYPKNRQKTLPKWLSLRSAPAWSGWSPGWMRLVDMRMATARTPILQTQGNGKAFTWPRYGWWWNVDLYLKPVCTETITHGFLIQMSPAWDCSPAETSHWDWLSCLLLHAV